MRQTVPTKHVDPSRHFDLCVIGSGSGLIVMPPDITERWAVALVDAGIGPTQAFGGTCLNAGCIPSKMFAAPAHLSDSVKAAEAMNVRLISQGIDFPGLQARIFSRTDGISNSGLDWQLGRDNVTVFRQDARFIDEHSLQVGDQLISADRFVIAAGSRPREVNAPGFDDPELAAFVHTSESIMRIQAPPTRLVILGGGTEAVEFAHIFHALGAQVSVINRSDRLLRKLDEDVATFVTDAVGANMSVRVNQRVTGLEPALEGGVVVTTVDNSGIEYSYPADLVLSVIGRVPNSDVLGVENTGAAISPDGFVTFDAQQRTTKSHIHVLGDICNPQMLKHLANAQARVVLADLRAELGIGERLSLDQSNVPLGIFSDPEVAAVGLTQRQAEQAGIPHVCHTQGYGSTAYGWALADDVHFVKLVGSPDGKLLGAHIVGPQATTLIQPLIMYLRFGLDVVSTTSEQFWIHPALTEVVENALLGLGEKIDEYHHSPR